MKVKPIKKYGKGEPIKALRRKINVHKVEPDDDDMSGYYGGLEIFPAQTDEHIVYEGLPIASDEWENSR